jgi:hypothetical protein
VIGLPPDAERLIRSRLEELGRSATKAVAGVTAKTGAVRATTIFLNCYLELSLPTREESLVASVEYRNNLGRFVVMADVCDDESGLVVWERAPVEVNPNNLEEIDRSMRQATEDLVANSLTAIVQALN